MSVQIDVVVDTKDGDEDDLRDLLLKIEKAAQGTISEWSTSWIKESGFKK